MSPAMSNVTSPRLPGLLICLKKALELFHDQLYCTRTRLSRSSDHHSLRRGQSIRVGAFVTRLPANNNMPAILL